MNLIKFTVTDSGDASGGIFPMYEEVSILFEYGGHDAEIIKEVTEQIQEALKGLGSVNPRVSQGKWSRVVSKKIAGRVYE